MQQKSTAKKVKKSSQKIELVKKPYLKGSVFSPRIIKTGLKLLAYELLFVFLNLLLGSALSFEGSLFLRIATNALLVAACAAIVYMDGARAGDADVAFAEIAYGRKESGKEIASSDLDRCYHPGKGFATVAVGTSIIFIIAAVYALIAEKQVYTLQALPSWVSAFSSQQEIALPLQYYSTPYSMQLVDVLRIIIRACIYPFVNMAGIRNKDALLLIDRLSPLLILIPHLFYAIGYLQGPRSRAMVHGSIASNTRKKQRRDKRERKARQEKTNQLI